MKSRWYYAQPERFPTRNWYIQRKFVFAPYWSDNDIRREGTVRYVVIKEGEGDFFDDSSIFISAATSLVRRIHFREFQARAMLVAQWENVHSYPHGADNYGAFNDDFLNKVQ